MRRGPFGRWRRMAKAPQAWTPTIGAPADTRFEREMVTPEGVDLRLRLAEASERAAAFLLDAAIMAGILIVLSIAAIFAVVGTGGKGPNAQIIMVIWLLGFFLLRNAYFILSELTPG